MRKKVCMFISGFAVESVVSMRLSKKGTCTYDTSKVK